MKNFLNSFPEITNVRYSGCSKTFYYQYDGVEKCQTLLQVETISKMHKSLHKKLLSKDNKDYETHL
jgi:hypothetical protein